jgi:hypothetical protein
MTCHEAREEFSAWLDDALEPVERARLEAHLEGCGDCRRELERLRQTVSLLRRVEPARAPVGFVDRVMAEARPTPWYRRALARAFLPLTVKVPLEAAALLLVAVGAVYVLQRTPELQQAARQEAPPAASEYGPAPAVEPPASEVRDARRAPAPPPRAREADRLERQPGLAKKPAEAPAPAAPSTPPAAAPSAPPAASAPEPARTLETKKEATAESAARPRPETAREQAEAFRPSRRRADSEERAKSLQAPAAPGVAAQRPLPTAHVVGRLGVKDREAAEQGLVALLARVGGRETGRRREAGSLVVEAVVPRAAYAEFAAGVARLGAWTTESEPAELPDQVRVVLRVVE